MVGTVGKFPVNKFLAHNRFTVVLNTPYNPNEINVVPLFVDTSYCLNTMALGFNPAEKENFFLPFLSKQNTSPVTVKL